MLKCFEYTSFSIKELIIIYIRLNNADIEWKWEVAEEEYT